MKGSVKQTGSEERVPAEDEGVCWSDRNIILCLHAIAKAKIKPVQGSYYPFPFVISQCPHKLRTQ